MYIDRISFEIQGYIYPMAQCITSGSEIFIESAFILIPLCYFHFPEKLRDSVQSSFIDRP